MNIDCLIPAAGLSSRMGTWKLILPYNEGTIVEESVKNALSRCSRIILVTGYRGAELARLFSDNKKVVPVANTAYNRGMFSSIQTGIPLIQTEYFFITMGDMPEIGMDMYDLLLNTMKDNPGIEIVRPLYNNKRGHPVLLKNSVISTILSEPADSEMKNVFTHHRVLDLPLNLPETFKDIDTEADYRKAVKQR